ncbi:MAG: L-threonylcarbamoyladenylate synthase [Candidatus Buchananbacteria bacterium]
MEIIKENKITKVQLKKIIDLLHSGGTIVYPTDTVYGLGCDATNAKGIKKIFLIKQRRETKPLPNICANLAMAKRYAKFSPLALRLAQKYWPGALNLVLPVKQTGLKLATARRGKVGLRVPNFGLPQRLAWILKKPLVSTSANLSGQVPCYNTKEVLGQFKNQPHQPDLIIDGGKLSRRNQPSTVAEIKKSLIIILRQGVVKIKI